MSSSSFLFGGRIFEDSKISREVWAGLDAFCAYDSWITSASAAIKWTLADHGRTLDELEVMPSVLFQLGKSKQDAQKRLPKWATPAHETRAIFGSSTDCLARIQEYSSAGATHLALRLVHPEESEQSIRTLVQEILPNL